MVKRRPEHKKLAGGPLLLPGHGFWTKEFILIELIALELDWFQLCRTHTSDHLPALPSTCQQLPAGKKCSRGGIYSQRKTGRGGLGGGQCE